MLSYKEFKRVLKALKEQDLILPNIALSLQGKGGWMMPYKRPHHPETWPLPIYHNDNTVQEED